MSDIPNELALDPARVERAIARLPFLEREALLMKARDGLSYAEIGAVLGLSPAEVERRVAAALVRLDARLERDRRPWWRFW